MRLFHYVFSIFHQSIRELFWSLVFTITMECLFFFLLYYHSLGDKKKDLAFGYDHTRVKFTAKTLSKTVVNILNGEQSWISKFWQWHSISVFCQCKPTLLHQLIIDVDVPMGEEKRDLNKNKEAPFQIMNCGAYLLWMITFISVIVPTSISGV